MGERILTRRKGLHSSVLLYRGSRSLDLVEVGAARWLLRLIKEPTVNKRAMTGNMYLSGLRQYDSGTSRLTQWFNDIFEPAHT